MALDDLPVTFPGQKTQLDADSLANVDLAQRNTPSNENSISVDVPEEIWTGGLQLDFEQKLDSKGRAHNSTQALHASQFGIYGAKRRSQKGRQVLHAKQNLLRYYNT
jgi:hypothetical protein